MGPCGMDPRDMALHNVVPLDDMALDNEALSDGMDLHNVAPHGGRALDNMAPHYGKKEEVEESTLGDHDIGCQIDLKLQ